MNTSPHQKPASVSKWRALAPLHHRDYRLLLGAVGLSLFGTGMWTIVMVFQVLSIDNSTTALSMVAACLSGGLFSFALVGGVTADRFSKRTIIITVQATNLAAVAMVTLLAFSGGIQLWHMALASAMLGAGSAFFYPAYSAFLPTILPTEELLAANGLEGALRPTMQQGIGPATGGMIVGAFLPMHGALIVAMLYALALSLVVCIRPDPRNPKKLDPVSGQHGIFADLREGISFTVKTRWLLWTLAFACLMTLIIMGPIEVLIPFIARDNFGNGEQVFGLLLTAFGVGGAVGSLVVSSLRMPRRYLSAMVLGWGVGTIPLAFLGITTSFWVMAAALFIVGFSSGAGMVIWGTLLQQRVPATMIGRVASLDFFITIALMPLSIALVGPIAMMVPTAVIFAVAGTTPVLIAVLAVLAGRMRRDEMKHPLDSTTESQDPIESVSQEHE
ncbi:major facilitator transporter [Arthrobacter sp. PAMC 25486]|uniref:MFS transporter n=1 Tax=Arthrobacter sp. PAMC 25486 TaxID=1494608 RepID=UPI0005363A52|nr:MFS transporter [Arthrobacter sp. PAMC 25486]AIY00032.1 major facilitator transporter [Arthrobacter sp. PAMC 25486]